MRRQIKHVSRTVSLLLALVIVTIGSRWYYTEHMLEKINQVTITLDPPKSIQMGIDSDDPPIVIDTPVIVEEPSSSEPIGAERKDVTKCLPEQRDVDACIEIYQPVCASVNVQCVTTPCPPVLETYANSCKACSNQLVQSYTEGECK